MNKPMTKRRVSQYITLKREIIMLEDQILSAGCGDEFVTDYAKDYSKGFPRIITLRGYGSHAVPKLSARKAWCIGECDAIEDFICNLEDSIMRQLLTRRYIEGRSIKETGELVGYSERQAGRLINDFFKSSVGVL